MVMTAIPVVVQGHHRVTLPAPGYEAIAIGCDQYGVLEGPINNVGIVGLLHQPALVGSKRRGTTKKRQTLVETCRLR